MMDRKGKIEFLTLGLTLTLLLCGLIWAVHRESPRTLVSFHGFVHAGIETRFLEPAKMQFPPENPFYAGEPLCYYWFYQFIAALLARTFGLNVFHALEALSFLAVAVLVFSALKAGRAFYGSVSSGALIVLLGLAGTNPLGAPLALFRILRYGADVLKDSGTYLWGVAGPVYGLIRYKDDGGLYGPFLNFFLNLTSRPVALAFLVTLVACVAWAWREPRPVRLVCIALAAAMVAAFNPLMSFAVTASLIFALLAVLLLDWMARGRVESLWRRLGFGVKITVALVLGTLLAAPTYYHLLAGPSERGIRLAWPLPELLSNLLTVLFSLTPLLLLALYGAYRLHSHLRALSWGLIVAALPLLLGSIVFRFPANNESNFFHAAALLLAMPAAGSVVRQATSGPLIRWRVVALLTLFLPSTAFLAESYLQRPPVPVEFSAQLAMRTPPDSDLAKLYIWVQKETPADAVFVLDPNQRVTAGGNISEFPAMTGRVLFTESRRHYLVAPYPHSEMRQQVAVKLQSGQAPDAAERRLLEGLRRPIFVVLDQSARKDPPLAAPDFLGAPVFKSPAIEVYRLIP